MKAKIIFRYNKKTGQKDIIIDFEAEPGSLRHEHEKKHRDLVKGLVGETAEVERLSGIPAAPQPQQEMISDQVSNQS